MNVNQAMERNGVIGLTVEVSHLQFADDTIMFIPHNNRSIGNAFTILQVFEYIRS